MSEYDQYFEWDETEYMRLRFIAARHYASCGHWDDVYAYILRTHPDDIAQHEDTYSRNAQAWHYTNARINELRVNTRGRTSFGSPGPDSCHRNHGLGPLKIH